MSAAYRAERAAGGAPALPGRRAFLRDTLSLAALSALSSCSFLRLPHSKRPEVVIVGGGLAGLTCAYTLGNHGIRAKVFEASSRAGGRVNSLRGTYPNDQVAELGGELIDSGHLFVQRLAADLGLRFDDLKQGRPGAFEDVFFFQGRRLHQEELLREFRPLAARMARAVEQAERDHGVYRLLDHTSVMDWLAGIPEISPLMRTILDVAYTEEFGLEAAEQSVFNLLYMIDYRDDKEFKVFGASDERFHIRGGNDLLVSALASRVDGQIETGTVLAKVLPSGSRYRVVFVRSSGVLEVEADAVVLAIPFTMLRQVNVAVPLSPAKRYLVDNLGYGTNAKLMTGYRARVWSARHRLSGSIISDNGLQTTWETSREQPGASGIITNFVGGRRGVELKNGSAEEQALANLPLLDQVSPGIAEQYIQGSAVRMHWPSAKWVQGSYACYRPGQWQYSGSEGTREGNVFFCGEHCSTKFQGFMEGACETGAKTAAEILLDAGVDIHGELPVYEALEA